MLLIRLYSVQFAGNSYVEPYKSLADFSTYIYRVNTKKPVISIISAEFGNFFLPNVMATNTIENWTILRIFWLFVGALEANEESEIP